MKTYPKILERFIRYAKIDTQSDPTSSTCPSTEKQKNLGRLLQKELKEMGMDWVELSEDGYVYAHLSSNVSADAPKVFFCSHMDTSPDCSGLNVKPILHENYDGRDLILPDDEQQIIRLADHPALAEQMGETIITASGTTLLGADNKAGLAEIMDAMEYLIEHPEIPRPHMRILFTPDEEIGRGVDKVDVKSLDADFGYTVDGESRGHIEDETFSADAYYVTIRGVASHPGFAFEKMQNAIKIASEIVASLPKNLSPESTREREGFLHPVSIKGEMEQARIGFILRDFDTNKLSHYAKIIDDCCKVVIARYPGSSFETHQEPQYRNMKEVVEKHPFMTDLALEAMRDLGMDAKQGGIRGGTDGSRLSFIGLPCPNLFAGEHAFHSKLEWVSLRDMELASATIVRLSSKLATLKA